MNIRVNVEPDDAAWRGQISLEPEGMTDEEQKSLCAHGVFEVEAGLVFDGSELEDPALADVYYTLEARSVGLPDNFPVIEVFTGSDADRKAAVWTQTVQQRIIDALVIWLALPETWESNTIHTIP